MVHIRFFFLRYGPAVVTLTQVCVFSNDKIMSMLFIHEARSQFKSKNYVYQKKNEFSRFKAACSYSYVISLT